MARYIADPEQILALVEKAEQIQQRIVERIADVEREVAALHVEWSGNAATAHRNNFDTWRREIADMKAALAQLESLARAAHGRYVANVAHNMRMWP